MFLCRKNVPGHLKKWPLAADGILNIKIHVFAQQTREEGEASDHSVEVLGSRREYQQICHPSIGPEFMIPTQ